MLNRLIQILCLALAVLCLASCQEQQSSQTPQQQTFVVRNKNANDILYYSGTILPKGTSSIASPIDGIVVQQLFAYGEKISVGQKMAVIESEELAREFVSGVSDYIKAIDDYADKERQYRGAEELKRLEFISENNYQSDKTAYQQAYFSKQQARYHLQQLLKKMDVRDDIDTLNLKDKQFIDRLLSENHNRLLIKSQREGIALLPSTDGEGGSKAIQEGSEVKKGQVLLMIGDFSGVMINIDVNQTDVQHLALKQAAEITSSAFPEHTLSGYISHIDQQARAEGRSTPVFSVTIHVPHLTEAQKQAVHIGMNAKVAIALQSEEAIRIPLAAVQHDHEQAWVMRLDDNHVPQKQAVVLGQTSVNEVVVKRGLQPGDTLVYTPTSSLLNEHNFSQGNMIVMSAN